ncbi:TniQ family protein [Ralstonia solanacearum]|uniref:TniQ family protein n=1 Tax=Ralstonia solanacearum TaxID=305 RepID=UPI002F951F72
MMLRTETMPYPRQEEISSEEDGVGFALRMAIANGLTFCDLARHLATPGHLYLPATACGSVAFMFGCTPERLKRAFVVRESHQGAQSANFLDHHFLRPYHLRQGSPQLCPACLEENHRALAAWSVCLVTSCPKHGLRLQDQCQCGRSIRWRRPALDICECGLCLTTRDQVPVVADARELAVSRHIADLLNAAPGELVVRTASCLPIGFGNLSIDTFLRLFWIFGIVDSLQAEDHPRCANRCLSTDEAAALVRRAFDRLASLVTRRASFEPVRIPMPALRALYEDCTTQDDLRCLSSLISRLHKRAPTRQLLRLTTIDHQLPLFGDADEPTT